MPRLPTSLIAKAHRVSPLVALLLQACRDIPSARNELRWISEHVSRIYSNNINNTSSSAVLGSASRLGCHEGLHLYRLCKSRSRGVPLQYILGTQPFGDLEVKCRRGVLIPRSETEAYTLELSRILLDEIRGHTHSSTNKKKDTDEINDDQRKEKPRPVRILDICSGTGCISLQLYAQLRHACPELEVVGLDISQKAIDLSNENIRFNNLHLHADASTSDEKKKVNGRRQSISYHQGDLFSPTEHIQEVLGIESSGSQEQAQGRLEKDDDNGQELQLSESSVRERPWDLIISNPPYISSKSFSRDTTRSVRNFEPKLALVPDEDLSTASASTSCKLHNQKKDTGDSSLVSSCRPEDIFYARILDLFFLPRETKVRKPPKRMLFEVADLEQASRVVEMMISCSPSTNATIEIWRDDPCSSSSYYLEEGHEVTEETRKSVIISGREIPIRGEGNARSVYFAGSGTGINNGER